MRDSFDVVKADFLGALERLRAGAPRNARLKALAKRGALRLNVSNVALEAGRSRTLIALESCRFPDVRLLVIEAGTASARGTPSAKRDVERLMDEVRLLRKQRDRLLSEVTSHFHARTKAEREAQRWHEAFVRATSSPRAD